MTGRKAKIENGQPSTTPVAAIETAIAGFSRRNNPAERLIAYMEKELGKKPDIEMKKRRLWESENNKKCKYC